MDQVLKHVGGSVWRQCEGAGLKIGMYFLMRADLCDDRIATVERNWNWNYTLHVRDHGNNEMFSDLDIGQFPNERLQAIKSSQARGATTFFVRESDKIVSFAVVDRQLAKFWGKKFPIAENEAYLSYIYTLPNSRGQGIASRLYAYCLDHLRSLGVKSVYSLVQTSNSPAYHYHHVNNAKRIRLYLHIYFGKQYNWLIDLKSYLPS